MQTQKHIILYYTMNLINIYYMNTEKWTFQIPEALPAFQASPPFPKKRSQVESGSDNHDKPNRMSVLSDLCHAFKSCSPTSRFQKVPRSERTIFLLQRIRGFVAAHSLAPLELSSGSAPICWKVPSHIQRLSCLKCSKTHQTAFSTAWCWWLDKRPVSLKAGASIMMRQACKVLVSHMVGWVKT